MMHLQNRPHPLSVTHPSAHTVAQSEMSLLSASLPAGQKLAAGGETEKEDLFYSREVGSFTDISFLSSFSAELNGAEGQKVTSSEDNAKKVAAVTFSSEQLQAKGRSEGQGNVKHVVEDVVEESIQSTTEPLEKLKEVKSGSMLKEILESIVENESNNGASDKRSLQSGIETEEEVEEAPGDASSTALHPDVSALPSHVKRLTNSQSWSESGESSSVSILAAPRASSLSYAMEHLPPLFSYDEGDEFSRSPSLHQGAKEISDIEQVGQEPISLTSLKCQLQFSFLKLCMQLSLHASVIDILNKEVSNDTDEGKHILFIESQEATSSTDSGQQL